MAFRFDHATIPLFAMRLEFPDDDSVQLDGRLYVTAQKLSEQYGLSASRIAHLARGGDVEAELLGRVLYVRPRSLDSYIDGTLNRDAR
jgi:hypothetical protein